MPDKPDPASTPIEKYGSIICANISNYFMLCELSEPKPKYLEHRRVVLDSPGWKLAHANGDRIVAAWNATLGISTEALAAGVVADAIAIVRKLAAGVIVTDAAAVVLAKLEGKPDA